jgi:hypothetical protein
LLPEETEVVVVRISISHCKDLIASTWLTLLVPMRSTHEEEKHDMVNCSETSTLYFTFRVHEIKYSWKGYSSPWSSPQNLVCLSFIYCFRVFFLVTS